MIDFSKYKFRASQLGNIMAQSRGKSNAQKYEDVKVKIKEAQKKHDALRDGLKSKENWKLKIEKLLEQEAELAQVKDVVELSATAKGYLNTVFIKEVYGREKVIYTAPMSKGHQMEESSITLYTENSNVFCRKNEETFENDYVTGTPDILEGDDLVTDIKTKWDIWAFMAEDGKSTLYEWQIKAYMWLTDRSKGRMAYTLVSTPPELFYFEVSRMMYMFGYEEGSEEMNQLEDQMTKNYTYDDIPVDERLKTFDYTLEDEEIEMMRRYIEQARKYLSSLSLLVNG